MAKARRRWLSLVNMDLASSAARWMLSSSVHMLAVPLPIGYLGNFLGGVVLVTSNSRTVKRSDSTSGKSWSMLFFTPSTSFRAVATTGIFVVWRRCRANWNPTPLLAGVTSDQAIFVEFLSKSALNPEMKIVLV